MLPHWSLFWFNSASPSDNKQSRGDVKGIPHDIHEQDESRRQDANEDPGHHRQHQVGLAARDDEEAAREEDVVVAGVVVPEGEGEVGQALVERTAAGEHQPGADAEPRKAHGHATAALRPGESRAHAESRASAGSHCRQPLVR